MHPILLTNSDNKNYGLHNLGFVRKNKKKIWKLILFQTTDKNKYTNFVKAHYQDIPARCLSFQSYSFSSLINICGIAFLHWQKFHVLKGMDWRFFDMHVWFYAYNKNLNIDRIIVLTTLLRNTRHS
jgi:hypothetical protein